MPEQGVVIPSAPSVTTTVLVREPHHGSVLFFYAPPVPRLDAPTPSPGPSQVHHVWGFPPSHPSPGSGPVDRLGVTPEETRDGRYRTPVGLEEEVDLVTIPEDTGVGVQEGTAETDASRPRAFRGRVEVGPEEVSSHSVSVPDRLDLPSDPLLT